MKQPTVQPPYLRFDMKIPEQAISIIQKLNEKGYIAYFAGGWVRDYLLQIPSDDIDIATNALPETVMEIFPKTVPIGLTFGIVLVIIGNKQYEVATFRSDLSYKDGRRPEKITFTNPQEDAIRRDFTINGMFFDPIENKILDYVGGREDIQRKIIKAIGNPHLRFQEDRLRMIRAVRLAARLNFTIDKETEEAIYSHAHQLFPAVAVERIWQEFSKITAYSNIKKAFLLLHQFGLLKAIFPELKSSDHEHLEKRIRYLDDYPSNTPTVAYVFSLFAPLPLEYKLTIATKHKLSKKEIAFLIFWDEADKALGSPEKISKVRWTKLYAHSFFSIVLAIHAAHLPLDQRHLFLERHDKAMTSLSFFITCEQKKTPIVKASHLLNEGIKPGPVMGLLLEKAQVIAIEENLKEPKPILEKLKQCPVWP
jgi:poly(A) polymerase